MISLTDTLPPVFEGLTPSVWVALGALISTGILLFVISYYAYFPTKKYLEERKKLIKDNIDNSIKLNQEANEKLSKADQTLKESFSKAEDHFEKIKLEAFKNKNEILEKAKLEALSILDENRKSFEGEKVLYEQQLKKDFVDTSILIAEKIIKENLNDEINKKLVNDLLKELDYGVVNE